MTTCHDRDPVEALKIAQQLKEYHHDALWKEEVHFTWLQSIILAADIGLIAYDKLDANKLLGIILFILPIIGISFAAITLRVLDLESKYFNKARERFEKQFNLFFHDDPISNQSSGEWSIRNCFKGVFWIFIIANIICFLFALCKLICPC